MVIDRDSLWFQLERMRDNLERAEFRIFCIRQEIENSHEREMEWRRISHLRDALRARALACGDDKLAAVWDSLRAEADEAAALELEQRCCSNVNKMSSP